MIIRQYIIPDAMVLYTARLMEKRACFIFLSILRIELSNGPSNNDDQYSRRLIAARSVVPSHSLDCGFFSLFTPA